jgi:hypothetical protein
MARGELGLDVDRRSRVNWLATAVVAVGVLGLVGILPGVIAVPFVVIGVLALCAE